MGSYDDLIAIVSEKMEQHKDDNSFGIINKINKELNALSGIVCNASERKDYCDFVVNPVIFKDDFY